MNEMKSKQQEKIILSTKAKAAKVYSRAEDLRLKLEEAIRASTGVDDKISPSFDMVHSHKKSKGSVSSFTVSPVAQSHQYLSPQRKGTTVKKRRKGTTVNKRVSVQSPRHFPSDTLTLSGSLESDSFSEGVLTIGSNSNDEDKVEEVLEHHVCRGTCAKSRGACRYNKPLQ
jgi:hypothetical protein